MKAGKIELINPKLGVCKRERMVYQGRQDHVSSESLLYWVHLDKVRTVNNFFKWLSWNWYSNGQPTFRDVSAAGRTN